MADAFKCDRCKQFHKGEPYLNIEVHEYGMPEISDKYYELCKDCGNAVNRDLAGRVGNLPTSARRKS